MRSAAEGEAREGFLRTAFVRAPAAIAAIGLDGVLISCNPAYGEIVGVEVDELFGSDATAFVHPDDLERAISSSIGHLDAGRSVETRPLPIRIVRHDGTTLWVQFDALLVDHGDGDGDGTGYVLATMTDVSARVASEQAQARSEAWFRAVMEHQSDIVTVVGFDGGIQYISPNCARLIGFTDQELTGTSGVDNIHPDDIDDLIEGLGAQLDEGSESRPFEYRQRCRDGSWLWLEATARQLPPELGTDAVIVNARDITERHRAAAAEREAQDRFRSAFSSSPLGIGFADLDGRLTWVNAALVETIGVPEAQLLELSFQDFSRGDELAEEIEATRRLLSGETDSFRTDRRYEHPDGRTIWTRLHVSLVRGAKGTPTQVLVQLEDVTDRKQLELSLSHDASHDPLTGLLNRSGLRGQIDAAWVNRRADAPMAILFGDLDGFKNVNDSLGHDAGDEVLAHVAQRLRAAVRAGDVVARWGGDEFVVLCPSVNDADGAAFVADRVRSALEVPFRIGPGLAEIGISVGVALDTGQPLPDLLMKDADAAAYEAKVAGKNRVVIAAASR